MMQIVDEESTGFYILFLLSFLFPWLIIKANYPAENP